MNEKAIIDHWQITYAQTGSGELITGSPNRTETRFLFLDTSGKSYIAEGYKPSKKTAQIKQNELLEFFNKNALTGIHPFCRTLSGEHGVLWKDLFWQIRPYIPGGQISRNDLPSRADLGEAWAEFLLQMKNLCPQINAPEAIFNAPFYMTNFLPKLQDLAQRKMPAIITRLQKIERSLAGFFKWERQAEQMFAHGDFHPGNILMINSKIEAVIDWEFAGLKFPGYDMALLIGCLGMDHPENLSSPAVIAFQNKLYRNDFMPQAAWEFLPQMIAAARLGWLGEWLTLNEEALVLQEIELISILLDG